MARPKLLAGISRPAWLGITAALAAGALLLLVVQSGYLKTQVSTPATVATSTPTVTNNEPANPVGICRCDCVVQGGPKLCKRWARTGIWSLAISPLFGDFEYYCNSWLHEPLGLTQPTTVDKCSTFVGITSDKPRINCSGLPLPADGSSVKEFPDSRSDGRYWACRIYPE